MACFLHSGNNKPNTWRQGRGGGGGWRKRGITKRTRDGWEGVLIELN